MLSRQRISIVDPRAGITRDRVSHRDRARRASISSSSTPAGSASSMMIELEDHVEAQIQYAIQPGRHRDLPGRCPRGA
jgi:predicted GTPase